MPKRIVHPKPDIDLAGRVACVAYIHNDKTYLWPAVIYQHYSEFQLHLGDQLTKKDTLAISFRLMALAQQRKKTPLVARLLGFADDNNQQVRYQEVDDQAEIYDYNQNVPSLIDAIHNETIFDKQSQESLDSYLLFAKAMDEAIAIMSATLPTITTTIIPLLSPLKSWLDIANEEVAKSSLLALPPSEQSKETEPLKTEAVLHQDMMDAAEVKALLQDPIETAEKASSQEEQVEPAQGRPKSQLKTPLNMDSQVLSQLEQQQGGEEDDQENSNKMDTAQDLGDDSYETPYKQGHTVAAAMESAARQDKNKQGRTMDKKNAADSQASTPESSSQGSEDVEPSSPTSPARQHRMSSTATVVSVSESCSAGVAAEEDVDFFTIAGIHSGDSFDKAWAKLQFIGWTCQKPSGATLWYFQPKANLDTGSEGTDYFDREGLETWLRISGWVGPRTSRSSTKIEKIETKTTKKKQSTTKKRKQQQQEEKSITKTPETLTKRMKSAARGKKSSRPPIDHFNHFNNVFKKFLVPVMGWQYKPSCVKTRDWCYLLPNKDEKTGTHLVDFFWTEEEVEEYCMQNNYEQKYGKEWNEEFEEEDLNEEVTEESPMDSKYVTPQPPPRGVKAN
jgi:hypothetical protein